MQCALCRPSPRAEKRWGRTNIAGASRTPCAAEKSLVGHLGPPWCSQCTLRSAAARKLARSSKTLRLGGLRYAQMRMVRTHIKQSQHRLVSREGLPRDGRPFSTRFCTTTTLKLDASPGTAALAKNLVSLPSKLLNSRSFPFTSKQPELFYDVSLSCISLKVCTIRSYCVR